MTEAMPIITCLNITLNYTDLIGEPNTPIAVAVTAGLMTLTYWPAERTRFMMDEVPVKISELCRPPAKVHLPVSLRTLWSSDSSVPVMAFELENKALHWVQERRRNLVSERSARSERLQLRDQAKREKREQQARQRADDEQRRLRDEEEQLRREERERLEEFRRRREQQENSHENAEAVPAGNETPNAVAVDPAAPVNHVCASAPAAAPSPPPVDDDAPSAAPKTNHSAEVDTQPSSEGVSSVRNTQIQMEPEGQDANGSAPASGPTVDPPPPVATETAVHPPPASQRPRENHSEVPADPTPAPRPPAVVSSNPFNPFLGRMQTAVMTPQTWQHRQVGGLPGEQRSGNFNYRDFESQASDPFDSAELNTINDMAELESVFRPLPVTAASHSQQQPPRVDYTSAQHAQRPAGHVQRPRYYTPAAGPPNATAAMSAATGSGYRVPDGRPQYPGAGFIRPPTAYTNAIDNKPSGADLSSEYRYASGRASDYRLPSAVAAAGRPSSLADPPTSVAASLPSQPDARGLQEFYARYYGPPARLRSSRSEPDLSEPSVATADGGDARRTKSHTPPPAPTGAAAPSTDTVRDWQSSTQPDPLAGLEPSVRARLQELSQMGFPLDRLRRLHSHFNGDEKQVIELCLSAQRLEEAGHSPLSAERGLLECDGDVGRAADFLSSLAQLTGLGFPEPRAAEALRRSDMHRDRALDLLIQG